MSTTEQVLARVEATLAVTRWEPALCAEIRSAYHQAATHGVFSALTTPERQALFLTKHVWAVWDFMSLLKSVQAELAPVGLPWVPAPHPGLTHLVNQIVLEEEGGFELEDRPASHFEYYLHAMHAAGADTQRIDGFLALLRDGRPWEHALERFAPPGPARFVRATMDAARAPVGERVAAFTLGREQLIPEMFPALANHPAERSSGRDFGPFRHYLERHVAIDGDEHGPASQRMLEVYAGDDPDAGRAALRAVQARIDLWDDALSAVSGLPASV